LFTAFGGTPEPLLPEQPTPDRLRQIEVPPLREVERADDNSDTATRRYQSKRDGCPASGAVSAMQRLTAMNEVFPQKFELARGI